MKTCFSLLCLFLTGIVNVIAEPLMTDVSAGFSYDTNVTRAELAGDIERDSIVNLNANSVARIKFNDAHSFSLRGSLVANQYFKFSKLSNIRLGAHASYLLRPFARSTATRYLGRLSYLRRLYQSNQRDGAAVEIELGINKQLSNIATLSAGYINQDIAADSAVFETTNNRFYIDLDFKITETFNMYLELGYINGDVVSTARSTQGLLDSSSAFVLDDAFRELTPDRFAYKISADTVTFKIGEKISLATNQTFDGSLLYYNTVGNRGHSNVGLLLSLNYLYKF